MEAQEPNLAWIRRDVEGRPGRFWLFGLLAAQKLNDAQKNLARIQRGDSGRAFQLCGLTFELTGPLRHVAKGPE